jgi:hypothetical protein
MRWKQKAQSAKELGLTKSGSLQNKGGNTGKKFKGV